MNKIIRKYDIIYENKIMVHNGMFNEYAENRPIYISASPDAVDVSIITKDIALLQFSTEKKTSLKSIAAIGDGVNDLPFLTIKGLGLIGAPSNAQKEVIKYISKTANGKICEHDFFQGFIEFYKYASESCMSAIFTDRDGVLVSKENDIWMPNLAELFKKMGSRSKGNFLPIIHVLTGSGVEQNKSFIESVNRYADIGTNQYAVSDPYIIHAENGAIQMNIITGEWRYAAYVENHRDYIDFIRRNFLKAAITRIEKYIFPKWDLQWSYHHSDQDGKIYMPEKRTMVTWNIPKTMNNIKNFRDNLISDKLRIDILKVIESVAEELSLPYSVIGATDAKIILTS